MKKRQIISIILTIGVLALSNKLWLATQEHAQPQIEIHMVLIILICGYLLAYKITDYLADFKTLENKSRIEIIFLTLFFAILFIPMMHIDNRPNSIFDRRYLSPKPNFFENKKINYKFGTQFNNWFTDRFLTRHAIVKGLNDFYSYISFSIGTGKYYKDSKNDTIYEASETNDKNAKEAPGYIKYLYQLKNFCNDNGIKLYVLIVPRKPAVYEPSYIKYNDENLKRAVQHEMSINKLNIIYPVEEFKKESKYNYIYFKTDHHWTDTGAFIGYQEVMKLIKRDFPQVRVLSKDDFTYFTDRKVRSNFHRTFRQGQTCRVSNVPDTICNKYLQTDYTYFRHKDFDELQTIITDIPYHREKKFYYPKGADLRVIMLGTSMNENLTEFIPFTFKNVYEIGTNNIKKMASYESTKIMKYHKQDILNYKPDIIIFCIATNNIPGLRNIFKTD